jgi:hypothetical protein
LVTFCVETAFVLQVIEGKIKGWIEVSGRRGRRRRRKLLDDLKERRGYVFWTRPETDYCMNE